MPLRMEADLRFNNNTTNYSRNFTVSIWKSYSLMRAYENFASVGRLEVLSTLNFSEATSGHPEFFVEKHGSPIFKTPASVPRQNSASANSSTHANVIQHWNWDTALTIPTSQALGLGEFGQHSSRFAAATETTRSSQKFRILPCVPLKKATCWSGALFRAHRIPGQPCRSVWCSSVQIEENRVRCPRVAISCRESCSQPEEWIILLRRWTKPRMATFTGPWDQSSGLASH